MPEQPAATWDWRKLLWEHLCELYKLYGGDCRDLARPASMQTVAFMWNVFNTQGPPDVSDPAVRARLLSLLDKLEKHLADPENDLDPATNQSLLDYIAAMRKAVGGGT
jgi:hypothetical protein